MASKMKQENEAIRNEAEADLSTFFSLSLVKSHSTRSVYFVVYTITRIYKQH